MNLNKSNVIYISQLNMSQQQLNAVITSDIGAGEVAFAAWVQYLDPSYKAIVIPIAEIRLTDNLNKLQLQEYDRVICFGDYWTPEVFASQQRPENFVHINFTGGHPLAEVAELLGHPVASHPEWIQNLIGLLDARVCGRSTRETQPLITGICNFMQCEPILSRWAEVFKNESTFDFIMQHGNTIMGTQVDMAKERVAKNSRRGTFTTGITYAVSVAPELVNLTHDALKEAYPDVDVTITVSVKFQVGGTDGSDDMIHQSLRAWNDAVDVKTILGEFGGGSKTASGGRRNVNISLDY